MWMLIQSNRLPRPVAATCAIAVLLAAGTGFGQTLAGPARAGGAPHLRNQSGPVALADFRGRVVLVYFGYLTCPTVCPNSLARIAAALRSLSPAERLRVAALFISVDPERDTPQIVTRYAAHFDPMIVGATGSPDVLRRIARAYGARFRKVAVGGALGYTVAHTSETYVLDPAGRLSQTLPHGVLPETIAAAIRNAL